MSAIVAGVLALIGGLLGTALPALLVTERTRRLRAVRQEQELLQLLDDEAAREFVTEALRVSAGRYADWATETREERARRQLFLLGFPCVAIGGAAGFHFVRLANNGEFEQSKVFGLVLAIIISVGLLVLGFVLTRWMTYWMVDRRGPTLVAEGVVGQLRRRRLSRRDNPEPDDGGGGRETGS